MAYETGTASDCFDLYQKLINFLTTDPDLVANAQNWAVVWEPDSNSLGQNGTDIVIRGPGLTASDQVYIGMRLTDDLLNDSAAIEMVGMTGIIPSSLNFHNHVNVTPDRGVRTFLRGNNPMDYWFTANGRRFVAVIQVSTVYEAMYGGLFLPFGDPTQYSYPLFIGGATGNGGFSGDPIDWRSTSLAHSLFHRPQIELGPSGTHNSSAFFLDPAGNWLKVAITDGESHNCGMTPWEFFDSSNWNTDKDDSTQRKGYVSHHARIIQTWDNEFVLTPIGMVQQSPSIQHYGVLEGIYHVPGRGNSAENVVNANGKDHICFPNAFRSGIDQWFAVELGYPEDSNSAS